MVWDIKVNGVNTFNGVGCWLPQQQLVEKPKCPSVLDNGLFYFLKVGQFKDFRGAEVDSAK